MILFPFTGNYPVTRKFGGKPDPVYKNYPGSTHPGTDYGLPADTPLRASISGKVTVYDRPASLKTGRGKEVVVTDIDGVQVKTCHMNRIDVRDGQMVKARDFIGLSGFTGYVIDYLGRIATREGAHLHVEVMRQGKYVDPEKQFNNEQEVMMYPNKGDIINYWRAFRKETAGEDAIAYWTTGTNNPHWQKGPAEVWKALLSELASFAQSSLSLTAELKELEKQLKSRGTEPDPDGNKWRAYQAAKKAVGLLEKELLA